LFEHRNGNRGLDRGKVSGKGETENKTRKRQRASESLRAGKRQR
jgi:hypothetical protein